MKIKPHDVRTKNKIKRKNNPYYQDRINRLDRSCDITIETDVPCAFCGNKVIHYKYEEGSQRIRGLKIACYGTDNLGCERNTFGIYVDILGDCAEYVRKAWAKKNKEEE